MTEATKPPLRPEMNEGDYIVPATPAPREDGSPTMREQIARIVNPFAWKWLITENHKHAYASERETSLEQADAILSLLNRKTNDE